MNRLSSQPSQELTQPRQPIENWSKKKKKTKKKDIDPLPTFAYTAVQDWVLLSSYLHIIPRMDADIIVSLPHFLPQDIPFQIVSTLN